MHVNCKDEKCIHQDNDKAECTLDVLNISYGECEDRRHSKVRRVDDLGRISIPKEIRKVLNVEAGSAFDIILVGNKIVLKPIKED